MGRIPASSGTPPRASRRSTIRTLPTQQAACSAVPPSTPGAAGSNPRREHEVGGVEPLVENRVRQVSVIPGVSETGGATDPPRGPPSRCLLVRGQQCVDEPDSCRASGHEQIVDIAMAELQTRRRAETCRSRATSSRC